MIIETELKLTIAEADIPKFIAHKALTTYLVQPMTRHYLQSVYFDTPDCCLLHDGFVLRIRKKEGRYCQTIKSVNESHNGLHQNHEWQDKLAQMEPDVSKIPKKKLREKLLCNKTMQPIFTTDINRICWNIMINETQIELALDVGKVTVGNRSEIISEVELELVNGQESNLFELAALFAHDINLIREDKSKAERGYKLYAANPV